MQPPLFVHASSLSLSRGGVSFSWSVVGPFDLTAETPATKAGAGPHTDIATGKTPLATPEGKEVSEEKLNNGGGKHGGLVATEEPTTAMATSPPKTGTEKQQTITTTTMLSGMVDQFALRGSEVSSS